jgi:hypothetical protein
MNRHEGPKYADPPKPVETITIDIDNNSREIWIGVLDHADREIFSQSVPTPERVIIDVRALGVPYEIRK